HVLIPLPDHDFDPTEAATPWRVCTDRGWKTTFATENGAIPEADPRLLMGFVRGPLGAGPMGLADYRRMTQTEEYQKPVKYTEIHADDYDALLLTGGHAPGMKQFLESKVLQEKVVKFFKKGKGIGAICHGLLVLARAIDPDTGKSVLYEYRTTSLTKLLEVIGYCSTFWLLGRRFRTYDMYVADEVKIALKDKNQYSSGLIPFPHVVVDRNLVTSRYWLFDAMSYSLKFAEMVESRVRSSK
ncbi:MAG TPA: type 1 glutamine amidotransferase domain-containing protein, partial [Anaerolineales bacterium]|nr:type 1 glutamine amidotransferase domain-containing protein [Anaerolineales bacterium]